MSFYQICIFVCVRGTEGQTGCRALFSPQIEKFNLHEFIGLYPSRLLRELTQTVAVVKMNWYCAGNNCSLFEIIYVGCNGTFAERSLTRATFEKQFTAIVSSRVR